MEGSENVMGGYQCSYPVFRGICHMENRLMERGCQSVYLMLCTLVDSKGNPMKEEERLVQHCVINSEFCTRYLCQMHAFNSRRSPLRRRFADTHLTQISSTLFTANYAMLY